MTRLPNKILIVEPDAGLVELFVAALNGRLSPQITCVADAEACLEIELVEPHDLVIAEMQLAGTGGLKLAEHLFSLSRRPVLLLADDPTSDELLAALRAGVADVLPKPFPITYLLDVVERLLQAEQMHRLHAAKYRRMREMVRSVIRERRDISRRTELVCRDLVGSHRRLVHRVIQLERRSAAAPQGNASSVS